MRKEPFADEVDYKRKKRGKMKNYGEKYNLESEMEIEKIKKLLSGNRYRSTYSVCIGIRKNKETKQNKKKD